MAKKTKIPEKLTKYLAERKVRHEILEHRTVYTAYDAAATMNKKLREIVKALLVQLDRDYCLVLLPADCKLDFKKLAKVASAHQDKPVKTVKIVKEKAMAERLKIRAGGLSAFGALYKLPLYLEAGLARTKQAVFPAGSFNHSLVMAVKDFIKLEQPLVGLFGARKNQLKIKLKSGRIKKKGKSNLLKRKEQK